MKAIFIGGCGRSGTTMLASMLGGHSRVSAVPESHFKTRVWGRVGGEFSPRTIPRVLAELRDDVLFKTWGLNGALDKASPDDFDGSYRQFVEYFVRQYSRQNGKPDFDYWVDHTPTNVLHAAFLLRWFPDAKLIHLIRDGRAVAASVLPLDWGPHSLRRAAETWAMCVGAGLAAEAVFPQHRVLRVRYEELVCQPCRTLERICQFVDVDCEPHMERGNGFRVPKASLGQHALVGSLPDESRVDAWKQRLTARQVELFEFYAGGLLELLGYATRYGIGARPPSARERLGMSAADAVVSCWRRVRFFDRHGERWYALLWKRLRKRRTIGS